MKLAFVHRKYTRAGGVEKNVVVLAEGLAARGHEVHVFCAAADHPPAPRVTLRKVPVLRLGQAAKYLSFAKRSAAMVAAEKFDLVQGFDLTTRQDVLRIGRGLVKVYRDVLEDTRSPLDRLWRKISPATLATASLERRMLAPGAWRKIVAISRAVAAELREAYAIPDDAIEVIYNGVDLERLSPAKAAAGREEARASFDLRADDRVVLFVGTGFRRKGLDLLVSAFRKVSDPKAKLVVVGRDGREGSYRSLVRSHGLSDRVVFAGSRPADAALYGSADLVVLPTRYEPFGNVVLEALACGVPAVTSAAAGASEILEEELSDLVVRDPADADLLASVIATTLAQPKGPLAVACRRVAERYSEAACVTRYENLYQRVIARRDPHSGEWKTVG